MKKKDILIIATGSIVALAASIYIIKKIRSRDDERPPKNAPQLDIENPGSQDNFPAAPNVSELG